MLRELFALIRLLHIISNVKSSREPRKQRWRLRHAQNVEITSKYNRPFFPPRKLTKLLLHRGMNKTYIDEIDADDYRDYVSIFVKRGKVLSIKQVKKTTFFSTF